MRRRFLKLIERPDWAIPCRIRLQIEYECNPEHPNWSEEDAARVGAGDCAWDVVDVLYDVEKIDWPGAVNFAREALAREDGFDAQIADYCDEDCACHEADED